MSRCVYRIHGVLFDFDGTLTRPGALDFPGLKLQLGCPPDIPVLEFIQRLEDPGRRGAALKKLEAFELAGAAASRPDPDAAALVHWIKSRRCPVGILTRNSRSSVLAALTHFPDLAPADFDLIISRDDPVAIKPSGDGIRLAARQWNAAPENILMVGDFLLDIAAGADAGALTALLDPAHDPVLADIGCDFHLDRLSDLQFVIQEGLPLVGGKLPNEMLKRYLNEFGIQDPSVIVGAGVGEDTAAVDITGEEVLVLKSDPITFATDAIGQYAVVVNANDIATAGARPRWLLTTLLLPRGSTGSHIRAIMGELAEACKRWGITLCGGHTELSDAVLRPVVVGMMAGTVQRRDLIEKAHMRSGDKVLVTKSVGVEATAIIAREFADQLAARGWTAEDIATGKAFLDQISILPEARLAAVNKMAVAMHDVTEGGLATAVEEFGLAGGHKMAVDLDKIPVHALTRKMCASLDLDPLGLIGSGSLLICCRPENGDRLIEQLAAEGIVATVIGEVTVPGQGISAFDNGRPVSWPRFEVDEITRLFNKPV